MEAIDVKVGEKVFVELKMFSCCTETAQLQTVEKWAHWHERAWLPPEHPVYPGLLSLCRRLTRQLGLATDYIELIDNANPPNEFAIELLAEAEALLGDKVKGK